MLEQRALHQQSHLLHFRLLSVLPSGSYWQRVESASLHSLTRCGMAWKTLPLHSPGEHGPSHLESDTAVLELNLHGDNHWDILIL